MGAVRDQENAGERESERGRMRKKKNAREGDVMVESSEEMPREKKSGRMGIEKTPAGTFCIFSDHCAVVYTSAVFHSHQRHQKES